MNNNKGNDNDFIKMIEAENLEGVIEVLKKMGLLRKDPPCVIHVKYQ